MRRPKGKTGGKPGSGARPSEGPEERAQGLLARLETDGPNPVRAAEELDRLQGALERAGALDKLFQGVEELCDRWAGAPLRGERARAWLTLVGGFGLKEHAGPAAEIAASPGAVPALRVQACRVLGQFGGEAATRALLSVLTSRADPPVRAAAAEALADLGDRAVRPVLEALLDEEVPRPVWTAVSAAVDRLR